MRRPEDALRRIRGRVCPVHVISLLSRDVGRCRARIEEEHSDERSEGSKAVEHVGSVSGGGRGRRGRRGRVGGGRHSKGSGRAGEH